MTDLMHTGWIDHTVFPRAEEQAFGRMISRRLHAQGLLQGLATLKPCCTSAEAGVWVQMASPAAI